MKYLFALIAIFTATLASAQITSTGGQVYLHEGDLASYTNPTFCVAPKFSYSAELWIVELEINCGSDLARSVDFVVALRKADIDALTGTGTETGALIDAIEQAVITILEAVPENAAITFAH